MKLSLHSAVTSALLSPNVLLRTSVYILRIMWEPLLMWQTKFYTRRKLQVILSLSLWLYSPWNCGHFVSFLILYSFRRTPWRGISPWQGHYLNTEEHKHRINAQRHQCLEWDSNPQSQCLNGRRGFMLRPLGHCDRQLVLYCSVKYSLRS
jgi:hypothetical protein